MLRENHYDPCLDERLGIGHRHVHPKSIKLVPCTFFYFCKTYCLSEMNYFHYLLFCLLISSYRSYFVQPLRAQYKSVLNFLSAIKAIY